MPKHTSAKFPKLSFFVCLFSAICSAFCVGFFVVKERVSVSSATAKSPRALPIYSVSREDKKIAISFDCAWGVDYTDKLLDIMQKNDVRCTFFAVQFWVEKYPDYAQKIAVRRL